MGFLVGTDVGGTFTDLWICRSAAETRVFKTPTSTDVLSGVIDALTLAAEAYALSFSELCSQIERFGHGTTIGLNALLTGNGAHTAIITTRGFADTLEIGRMRRQSSGLNEAEFTDAYLRNRFPPLVPRDRVIEVDERIDANGAVIVPLDERQAHEVIAGLRGVEAIAVCTLFATVNPVHEIRLRKIASEICPDAFVSVSHEISPAVGEYARMSTTAANASLGPLAGRYLAKLERTLREAGMMVPVMMMTCSGGVMPTELISDRPALALFSGPAAGVMGSQVLGAEMGVSNILTTDIGGTSFDVGVIVGGRPVMRSEISLAGADIRVLSIDVDSIGAGGGSIASIRGDRELQVGPRSAGSTPGPACYGRNGTEPTATDADLVLGVLDPETFLGGRMRLDTEAARRAIEAHIARPLGISIVEAAWGIRKILDSRMADLLRRVTVQRGYDPRDFTLFANGGAGPSHAWALSAELGLNGFVVPAAATVQSAYGVANANVGFTAERAAYLRLAAGRSPTESELRFLNAQLESARAEVSHNLLRAKTSTDVAIEAYVSIRFRGQTNHLDVLLDANRFAPDGFAEMTAQFQRQYEVQFGRGASYANAGFEILAVRVVGLATRPPSGFRTPGAEPQRVATRDVVFEDPGRPIATAIFTTRFPAPGTRILGPAIVEFPGQSVVIPPGASAAADDLGNLHVRIRS